MSKNIPKTEQLYKKNKPLDLLSISDGISLMIKEQKNAALEVKKSSKSIKCAINKIFDHLTLHKESRLIYVGAGTSGRIGVQDGVELYPTFNWPKERVEYIIAGGKESILGAVENAEDNTKLVLSIFLLFLICTILFSLSLDIYKKFNSKSSLVFFEKDQTYIDIENKLSDFRYDEIDHEQFLDKLILLEKNNFYNFFEISVLDNNTIYYMVSNNTQKTQKFGAITWDNPLYLYFNDDFSIDLSNINLIDKIVVNNSIYQIDVNKPYALKDFNLYNFIDLK